MLHVAFAALARSIQSRYGISLDYTIQGLAWLDQPGAVDIAQSAWPLLQQAALGFKNRNLVKLHCILQQAHAEALEFQALGAAVCKRHREETCKVLDIFQFSVLLWHCKCSSSAITHCLHALTVLTCSQST